MITGSQEVGMFCFVMSLALIVSGIFIWKKQVTKLIPGYQDKKEKQAAYCALSGKGVIMLGIGIFILSVPLSLPDPDKYFALCCMICCLAFTGEGIYLYVCGKRL